MPAIGDRVHYKTPEHHETKTVRDGNEILGSIHHPSQREFAGMVGGLNEDGTASILIFPPNRQPTWIDAVPAEHFDVKG
jgi:hypothetical protein